MDTQEAIVAVLTVGMVVGLPMMALSLRFALKPVIEAWAKARELSTPRPSAAHAGEVEALKLRVAALEAVWEHRLGAGTLQPASKVPQLVD